jgi:hypothetical protein
MYINYIEEVVGPVDMGINREVLMIIGISRLIKGRKGTYIKNLLKKTVIYPVLNVDKRGII